MNTRRNKGFEYINAILKDVMKKAEREHLFKIKNMDCIACGAEAPTQAHHICQGGRRLGHFFTLPLCPECHEGTKLSIGNTKKSFVAKYGSELELLEKVRGML